MCALQVAYPSSKRGNADQLLYTDQNTILQVDAVLVLTGFNILQWGVQCSGLCGRDESALSVVVHSALLQIMYNLSIGYRSKYELSFFMFFKATNTMDMETEIPM